MFFLITSFAGKTKRRDSKKKSETGDNQHREQNLLSGGRIVDNQSKWKKLGYKGDAATQGLKTKEQTILPSNDLQSATRKIGEIRRTSDGDLTRAIANEKSNVLNAVGSIDFLIFFQRPTEGFNHTQMIQLSYN